MSQDVLRGPTGRFAVALHRCIVAPATRRWSSDLLWKRFEVLIQSSQSILNLGAGDDPFVLRTASTQCLVVACDMDPVAARFQHELARERMSQARASIQGDATQLPIRGQFDLVIMKNLLHHLQDGGAVTTVLQEARRVGRQIGIIEIEDPRLSLRGRIWNAYYRLIWGGDGDNYLSASELRRIVLDLFPLAQFERLATIKGDYLIVLVT